MFEGLFESTTTVPKKPARGGIFGDVFAALTQSPSQPPTKTSTSTPSKGAPVTFDVNRAGYFQGKGYGASYVGDSSGRPLLTFNNASARQSQLLTERVATKFDPTVPTKLNRKMLVNGRMPSSVASKIKKDLGGAYSEELDHRIALSLAGSNQGSNLGLEPGRIGGRAAELNKLVNQLSRQVSDGKISLLEGQRRIAEAKGIKLADTGANPGTRTQAPVFASKFRNPETFRQGKDFRAIPKELQADQSSSAIRKVKRAANAVKDFGAGFVADPGKADPSRLSDITKRENPSPYELGIAFGLAGPADEILRGPKAAKKFAIDTKEAVFDAGRYVAENLAKREAAKGGPKLFQRAASFLKNAKTKLVDFAAPIEDVVADTLKRTKTTLKPSQNISNAIDRVLRAPTIAGQFIRDGGLENVIKKAPDLDALDEYLIARHARTLARNGIETGRDLLKDGKLIDTLASEYEPIAKAVTGYSQKLLDYSVDTGLISKNLAARLKEIYPDYVPFNRIFEEGELVDHGFSGGKAVASLSKQTIVQKLTGSAREIASPIESLIAKTNDAFRQGEKNIAARILASYKDLPGNPFNLRELQPGESAVHSITYLDDGVKRTFETTKEIAAAAKALNVQQLNILGKIFALPVRVAKLGITGINIPFVASNVVKDQVTAFINSNKALQTSVANPVNFVRSLFSAVRHDKLYEELVREGAGGTSFDIARDQIPATVKRIRAARSLPSRIRYTVTHPGELLRAVENTIARSEELTRLQQYRGTKLKLVKEGMPEAEARIAAAKAARENTVNFARRGEWGAVLNSAFLYLNAGIQGTRTLIRSAATRPLATGAKIATSVFMPVSIATAWNMNDPSRRAAYEDIPEFEKQNNIIIIPPDPTKDEKGRWNVIKIPLAQGVNDLSTLPRRAIEQAFGYDPLRAREIAEALISTVSPIAPTKGDLLSSLTPQAIKPALEEASNTNFFTGRNIVPPYKTKLPPEEQVFETTSGSARKIGKALGVSPIKVESYIRETFGGVGSQVLNMLDRVTNQDIVGGESTAEATTRRFTKATGGELERRDKKK